MRADTEVLPDEGDALRPESLNLQQIQGARREFLEQLIAAVERTAPQDLLDGVRESLADAREFR